MEQTQNLNELMAAVQSGKDNRQLFISQQEKSPGGVSLGDEDTGGSDIEVDVKVLLADAEQPLYFEKTYTSSIEYEEVSSQINKLEQSASLQKISPGDMENKVKAFD